MLIKITDKCNMGCNHCMSDCTPNLCDMELNTFKDALDFNDKYNPSGPILISGGEPTESSIFHDAIDVLIHRYNNTLVPITITTNGIWLSKNEDFVKMLLDKLSNCTFQIVVDDRYYPIHVDESSPIFNYKTVLLCRDVITIYPQGRALTNNLQCYAKSSKCFNIRALTKQMPKTPLSLIMFYMNVKGFFCTPHIDIDGNIKLGESRLCPVCSNIYKTEDEIINDILSFKCNKCDFINDKLPENYKKYIK